MSELNKISDEKLENVSGGKILQKGPEEFYIIDDLTNEILAGPYPDATAALLENWFTYHQSDGLIIENNP